MNGDVNQNAEKSEVEEEDFFEIPVITMSSPSTNSDSDAAPKYLNSAKRSSSHQFQSDEEVDTSFIANNNTVNGRVSILRSLSPNSMNASGASRGVSLCFECCIQIKNQKLKSQFKLFVCVFSLCRMFDVGLNR